MEKTENTGEKKVGQMISYKYPTPPFPLGRVFLFAEYRNYHPRRPASKPLNHNAILFFRGGWEGNANCSRRHYYLLLQPLISKNQMVLAAINVLKQSLQPNSRLGSIVFYAPCLYFQKSQIDQNMYCDDRVYARAMCVYVCVFLLFTRPCFGIICCFIFCFCPAMPQLFFCN